MIEIQPKRVRPLEMVTVKNSENAEVRVYDGQGREYIRKKGTDISFQVSGTLGYHVAASVDSNGKELERTSFSVHCETEITDDSGTYKHLLYQLLKTMTEDYYRTDNVKGLDNRVYRGFVITSRDHIHGQKAMKYFYPFNREWIDVFAEHQREDGMVWDFFLRRNKKVTHHENRYPKEFYKIVENGDALFARQPVMNDLEHMFIQGIYQTWKTTGDDEWMKGKLDNGLKALSYATSSPYMWSEKYQLVKRTFCIDLWDFQSEFDAALVKGDPMMAIPGVSQYGIMHGDNTGMAIACDYLAEMLEYAGRTDEASEVKSIGDGIRRRLDAIAWNGAFYRHFIPEDPTFERDFGVDTDTQVSLSNAYALNRRIPHEKAAAIIKTYLRLREETKESAPAEWFCMYPPFERGFGTHGKWHYVNGGVSPMVAGELAHGAFEHGFESYGADIISRVAALGTKYELIPRVWRGELPNLPDRSFTTIDLRDAVNTDFYGTVESDAIPWTNEGDNDLREMPVGNRAFRDIPFDVIDPEHNARKACVGLSVKSPYARSVTIPVGRKAQSVYFLHTMSKGKIAGELSIDFADGTTYKQYVISKEHVDGWWCPSEPDPEDEHKKPNLRIGWHGRNAHSIDIGVMVYGLDNPEPDKQIRSITLNAGCDGAYWMVLGITLSDYPVFFLPSGLSRGIPAPWSCGAVVYAMMEGMAGVYDTGRNYDAIRICPRWTASETKKVTVGAKYEESGGYVRYTYGYNGNEISIDLTSSADDRSVEVLLPSGKEIRQMYVNDREKSYDIRKIEQSDYACFTIREVGVTRIKVVLG